MEKRSILVTGGAGYVGAVLVPKLLTAGHTVRVLDWYLYGEVFESLRDNPRFMSVNGDIRDRRCVSSALDGCDTVIHLACISNDPSCELDPGLSRSVNLEGTKQLVDLSLEKGIRRFVYASSSSVYGIKSEAKVTEKLPLAPLTDYSRYKADGERYLLDKSKGKMVAFVLRPATVCGYSPRMRFDLTVNILTISALVNRKITVLGGAQKRPSLHIEDMTDLYVMTMEFPDAMISGKVMNAGYENYTVMEIAEMVKRVVGDSSIGIEVKPTDDNRSYHIDSSLIRKELGFVPVHTVDDAILDIKNAFIAGRFPDAMTNPAYYNVRTMKSALSRLLSK